MKGEHGGLALAERGVMKHLGNQLLKDKIIVISGGTKGVGRGLAIECAYQGAKVIIGGRDRNQAAAICSRIKEELGGICTFVYTDLHNVSHCKKLFDTAIELYGRIDGFVNYAGVTPVASLTECEERAFDDVFAINIKAAFFCMKYAVKYMQASGGGSIVSFGSVHTWVGEKDRTAYACSKGALYTLSEHIAHHYAEDHIRSNFLTMGWVPTEGELSLRKTQGISAMELSKIAEDFIPMGRMQTVEDHVPAVIYLLSDLSEMVTGSNLRVAGGMYVG